MGLGFSDRIKRVGFVETEGVGERSTYGGKGLKTALGCVCSFISTLGRMGGTWCAGESEHIKNRLRSHSPVYPMKQLTQKLTKTTVYWTGGRTEQQEAEGLSMGSIKVSLSSMKTTFSLQQKEREREQGGRNLLFCCGMVMSLNQFARFLGI